jgi:hypothetical protein
MKIEVNQKLKAATHTFGGIYFQKLRCKSFLTTVSKFGEKAKDVRRSRNIWAYSKHIFGGAIENESRTD